MLKKELKRMLLEFIQEIESEGWFGKEHELVSRFGFSKLAKNIGCCEALFDVAQISVEVRVLQIPGERRKREVSKDLVIWKKPNQTVWSEENVPLCIIEWKHGKKRLSQYDIDWLKDYTEINPGCFGIAVNVKNKKLYELKAALVERGEVVDRDWV
jgi:hypothetical protein